MFFEPVTLDLLNDEDFSSLSLSAQGLMRAYANGYNCGVTWPDAWETHGKPGGPWTYNAAYCHYCDPKGPGCDRQITPRFTCAQSREHSKQAYAENKLWRQGWQDGRADKHKDGRSFSIELHIALERELNAMWSK